MYTRSLEARVAQLESHIKIQLSPPYMDDIEQYYGTEEEIFPPRPVKREGSESLFVAGVDEDIIVLD